MACVRLSLERRYTGDGGGTNGRDTSVKVIPALRWHFECTHLSISTPCFFSLPLDWEIAGPAVFFYQNFFSLSILGPPAFLIKTNEQKVSTSWKQRECIRNVRHVPSFQERSSGNWSRLLARHLTLDIILRNKEYSIGFLNSSPNGYPPNCWNVASGRAGFLNSRSTSLPRSTILPRDAQLTS